MTKRIDRLEARGYVKRVADPTDRRVVLVRLTPEGRALVDETAETHYRLERELLQVLTPKQRNKLAATLRSLLVDLGDVPAKKD